MSDSMLKDFVPTVVALAMVLQVQAETPPETKPPQRIDVSKLPQQSKMMDDVVVPVPSEIFGVLDKLQKPRWSAVQRTGMATLKPIGEQAQIALLLGTVIAEGFIAVEAEDTAEVKNIGTAVLTLSRALGVEKQVKERAKSITEAAEKKEWKNVRHELDKTLNNVSEAMGALNNEQVSQLVSLGGWLRGTEALTKVVSDSFTKDGAELLHQPVLLDYFERRLAGMRPKIKGNSVVTQVQKGILEIRPLVGIEDGTQISEKTVKDIGAIASALVKTITSKAP